MGFPQDFCGPGAKQHRMFLLTLAALVAAVEGVIGGTRHALPGGLAVIVVLACVTIARRLIRLARALHAR